MSDLIDAIFLDTNVFESSKFNYKDNYIEKLFHFCYKNKVKIFINEVVLGEVKHRISENANKTVSGLTHEVIAGGDGKKVLIRKDNLLYLSRIFNMPSKTKDIINEIENSLLDDFNEIKDEYLTVIKTDVDAQEIMTLYFDVKPPFESGKKKEEFPDAIIGFDIKNYSKENKLNILTITNDNGLSLYLNSEKLTIAPRVNEALHLLIEQSDQMDKKRVESIIKNSSNKIKIFIEENTELWVYSYDFENTVESFSNEIISLEVNNINILEIMKEDEELSFEISCQCEIEIKVITDHYPDYDTGMRDKETDTWYYHSTIQSTHEFSHTYDFEILIHNISDDSDDEFEMENESGTIEIEYDLYDDDTITDKQYFDSY